MPRLPTRRTRLALLPRRLVHVIENHGVRGALLRAFGRGLQLLRGREARLLDLNIAEPGTHPFDRRHGTDTAGYVPGEQLTSALAAAATLRSSEFFNTAYYAISPSTLELALTLLPAPLEPFTFVDLGCGKGRALLLAAQSRFAAVAGVELSPALCAVARSNAAAAGVSAQVHHADAATFAYPPGPLVVFLYHPFLRPVLRRVLRNLHRQLLAAPRPLFLLYANPGYQATLAAARWLSEVWDLSLRLSNEDAAADRHGITHERYTLYRAEL